MARVRHVEPSCLPSNHDSPAWHGVLFGRNPAEPGMARAGLNDRLLPRTGDRGASGCDLAADLPARIGGAVHVDVEVSQSESLVLGVVEPYARWNGPDVVACLVQRHDHRTVRALGTHV